MTAPGPSTVPAADDLLACEYCDAVYRRLPLAPGERARCLRCGGELYRHDEDGYRRLLPLVLAALALFLVSNAYPIVELDLRGVRSATTLWGAVAALYADHMGPVAVLVCATTILFPLAEMLMLLHLLLPLARGRRPAAGAVLLRTVGLTRPWGMVEVFLIGVLVSLVKLSAMARVLPGIALWSFAALVVVLSAVLSFDPRGLWRRLERAR